MREIKLTQGYVALVDDEDYPYLSQFKWHIARRHSGVIYACRAKYLGNYKSVPTLMHRELVRIEDAKLQIDHVDHDGLNNQRSNLRVATRSENLRNRRLEARNTSGRKGVYWHRKNQKWVSQIRINGATIHIGCFDSLEEAGSAYDKSAIEHFGRFAYTNEKALA